MQCFDRFIPLVLGNIDQPRTVYFAKTQALCDLQPDPAAWLDLTGRVDALLLVDEIIAVEVFGFFTKKVLLAHNSSAKRYISALKRDVHLRDNDIGVSG